MNQQGKQTKKKGGRPAKDIRKSTLVTLKCTAYEKMVITEKAREANLTTSEYVREISLKGIIERKIQQVPVEVLAFKATLNHMAANLNQIARKRNSFEQLSDSELGNLRRIVPELKEITLIIKNLLQ